MKGFPAYLLPLHGQAAPPRVAVLHAALDARIIESFCALSVGMKGNVVLVTAAPARADFFMRRLLPKTKRFASDRGVRGFRASSRGLTFWIVPHWNESHPLPFRVASHLLVESAHRSPNNPADSLLVERGGRVWMAGEPAEPGHWWDTWRREDRATLIQVDADAIVKAFPTEASRILPESSPLYWRMMRLDDEVAVNAAASNATVAAPAEAPHVFFRKRLFVRTDKGRLFLDERQQAEATKQLGADWESGDVGTPIVPFILTPIQRRYLAIKRAARRQGFRRFLILKHRRVGVTTIEQALSYRLAVSAPNTTVLTLAHRDQDTQEIFRMVRLFHEMDPMKPERINDSERTFEFANGSVFNTGTAGAFGFARGGMMRRAHLSEVAKFCRGPNQDARVDDLMASIMGAASHGEIAAESTADGANNWFARTYKAAQKKENAWFPIFLPWYMDPANAAEPGTFSEEELRDTIDDQEQRIVQKYGLTLAQLAWRRKAKREYGRLFPQEFPENEDECFFMSGHAFFDPEIILALIEGLADDYGGGKVEHLPGGERVTWKEPKPGASYSIGHDPSLGKIGGDPNGYGILENGTGEQVAEIHGLFSIKQQAEFVLEACRKYNRALMIIERTGSGIAVVEKVIELGGSLARSHLLGGSMFYHIRPTEAKGARDVKITDAKEARAGWETNDYTRTAMLDDLSRDIETKAMKVRSRRLLSECLSFRLQKDGKYRADSGAHDDAVMKWAMAAQGARLKKYAGGMA